MATRQTGGRARAAIFLLISAAAAVVAVLIIYRVIMGYQQQLAEAQKPPETINVVVAKRDLFQGQTLSLEDVEIRAIEPDFVPEVLVYHATEEVVGRVPAERIVAGEYVRSERLADPEAGVGMNAIIPRGMRAVSINISNGSAVSGFLNPGNYVDVLVTIKGTRASEPEKTVTMMQAAKLLAVNSRMYQDDDGKGRRGAPSVTLAVTPEDAERLAHATRTGSVTLTLRNDIDVQEVELEGKELSQIIGRGKVVEFTKVVPKRQKPVIERQLEIYRGSSTQKYKIPN